MATKIRMWVLAIAMGAAACGHAETDESARTTARRFFATLLKGEVAEAATWCSAPMWLSAGALDSPATYIGTWRGHVDDEAIELTFAPDNRCLVREAGDDWKSGMWSVDDIGCRINIDGEALLGIPVAGERMLVSEAEDMITLERKHTASAHGAMANFAGRWQGAMRGRLMHLDIDADGTCRLGMWHGQGERMVLRAAGDIAMLEDPDRPGRTEAMLVHTRRGRLILCQDDTAILNRTEKPLVRTDRSVLENDESISIALAEFAVDAITVGFADSMTLVAQPVTSESLSRQLGELLEHPDRLGGDASPRVSLLRELHEKGDAVTAVNLIAVAPGMSFRWGMVLEQRDTGPVIRAILDAPLAPEFHKESEADVKAREASRALFERAEKAAATRAQRNRCINNLRQIDAAKEQWAMAERKREGDPIDKDEVGQYIKGAWTRMHCPSGGQYTIGPIGTPPSCNHPGHEW